MSLDFENKVFLITGAGSGIGGAAVIHLAKLGANIAMVGRNENNLRKISLYCEKVLKRQPYVIAADVTDDEAAKRIINETVSHFGKLDVLVNNAGVVMMGGIKNTSMEAYDKVMSTNMRSVYHLTMLAVPHLAQTKGSIINISCTCSTQVNTMALAYNISKAALDHFTKCVSMELASDGIRVNSINPGFVRSNLYKDIGLTDTQLDMFITNVVRNSSQKKAVEAGEVAKMIAHLASDEAKDINGENMVMDG